ncbi:MAG: M48 family metallopeptidase [Planctomycetota bacterium]
MATDFYQRQSDARRGTVWLVILFGLAVILIVGSVVAIATLVVEMQTKPSNPPRGFERYSIPAIAGITTTLLILAGTLYKVFELRDGGGTRVAESLGGHRLFPNTEDSIERRLLNVVEEMAIASGTPVPPVFLLDEDGINAFAAGYSPSDAVLGVTRGCAESLSRDELQGVIAHEFSHILNGDMRMSIKLIGILHGILLIGLTGQLIFRTFIYAGHGHSRSRNSKNDNGGQAILVILAVAVAVIVLGSIGTFFGNLIKAAVSRQREYLADSSAVQFTRNPSGIAGALKRIGGMTAGSRLQAANASEVSHMYFSQGVWEGITGLWATHPPLPKRIIAIDPSWDGRFLSDPGYSPEIIRSAASANAAAFTGSTQSSEANAGVPIEVVDEAYQQVGEPTTRHRDYAAELIRSIPKRLVDTVHDPYGARAVVYALLLDKQLEIRASQSSALKDHASKDIVALVQAIQPLVDGLDIRARLPLVDLAIPSLKAMSARQFKEFAACFEMLVAADNKIDLFEWMLFQVVTRHLRTQYIKIKSPPIRYYGLQRLSRECSILLSIVGAAGNSEMTATQAFQLGQRQLPELPLTQLPQSDCRLDLLREVLQTLEQVSAKQRGRLVDACAAAICADGHVTWQEAELLRGIADLLACPMPPLLVEA